MERIEKEFSVVFSAEQSPYFQVEEARRFAFTFNQAKGRPSFQKQLIEMLFGDASRIDLLFLKSYVPGSNKRPRSFEKRALHQAFFIRNWREYVVFKQELDVCLIYVEVQDITPLDVFAYIRSIARGKKPSFIGFYNNRFLLTVDDDEFIVISKSSEDLEAVRDFALE